MCSLPGSPELAASGADPKGHTPRREAAAARCVPGLLLLHSQSLGRCIKRPLSQEDPLCSWGLSSWPTHLLLQEASSQADHRRPGMSLHAAGQKACRVPQIERGARRTEDTPKVGRSRRTAVPSWLVTPHDVPYGHGPSVLGNALGDTLCVQPDRQGRDRLPRILGRGRHRHAIARGKVTRV